MNDSMTIRSAPSTRLPGSRIRLWVGRMLLAAIALWLSFEGIRRLLDLALAMRGAGLLGSPLTMALSLGAVLLAIAVLLLLPRSTVTTAIVQICLLGGAFAACLHAATPMLNHMVFSGGAVLAG